MWRVDAFLKVTSISSGVKSLIAFSPKSSQLWMLPINSSHLTVDGQWKCLNLPVEGRECVLAVSSGLSHTAVLSDVGKGNRIENGHFSNSIYI